MYEDPDTVKPHLNTQGSVPYGHAQLRQYECHQHRQTYKNNIQSEIQFELKSPTNYAYSKKFASQ